MFIFVENIPQVRCLFKVHFWDEMALCPKREWGWLPITLLTNSAWGGVTYYSLAVCCGFSPNGNGNGISLPLCGNGFPSFWGTEIFKWMGRSFTICMPRIWELIQLSFPCKLKMPVALVLFSKVSFYAHMLNTLAIYFIRYCLIMKNRFSLFLVSFVSLFISAEIAACCWAICRINFLDAKLWWSYGNMRVDVGLIPYSYFLMN